MPTTAGGPASLRDGQVAPAGWMTESNMSDSAAFVETPSDEQSFPPLEDAWFLTGPTAAGKTSVGMRLAERLGAEILSMDSMAIYRGMDIGTAKPPAELRRCVPHHLLDIVDPTEEFSVSEYLRLAHRTAAEVRSRGKVPLFVGGTPLYLKALTRGLYPGPPPDWEFRRQAEREAKRLGVEALHRQLALIDPLAAAKLHPHDLRRIIRALEVFHLTGRPISHQQLQFEEGRPAEECRVFVLSWPRPLLHARIERRVQGMFEAGLVDEVRRLLERYGRLGRTASQAVGYREVQQHLAGELSWEETIRAVTIRTRQFARRQETWFRQMSECRPVAMSENEPLDAVVDRILASASLRADRPGH
ncbi:MAG: tRNA dimethylallyltransferase [Pirellulaceae bacterium]|nr:MAG: tRNA dimethylallyltransferase [Pirellulaceae bacterium]